MTTTSTTDILIAGEALIDIVRRLDGTEVESPGGSPANVAITLGRLGRAPALVTHLGDDERGRAIDGWLAASDVAVVSTPRGRTSTAKATLDDTGAATYEFDITLDIDPADAPPARAVHTGSIATVLAPASERILALIDARRSEALITYDPNIRPSLVDDAERVRRTVMQFISRAHAVKASDEDVEFLRPGVPLIDVAREWISSGARLVVITRGGEGAVVVRSESSFEITTPRVVVADTVGAGDTFMGAMIDGLLSAGVSGADARQNIDELTDARLRSLLERAARAASITVSRAGANPPTAAELG